MWLVNQTKLDGALRCAAIALCPGDQSVTKTGSGRTMPWNLKRRFKSSSNVTQILTNWASRKPPYYVHFKRYITT